MDKQEKQFKKARQSMVQSQIHPMGVSDEKVLEAFNTVPREYFVPEDKKCGCYCDEDIEIATNRFLMEPAVLARLIQAADLKEEEVALTIGSGVGYNAAILSHLVTTVVALEEDKELIEQAQKSWDELSYCNIAGIEGTICEGAKEHAPYDVIIINGAVCEIPEKVKAELNVGGRLMALVKAKGQTVAKAMKIKCIEKGRYEETILFDAGTPYLPAFAPKQEFVF